LNLSDEEKKFYTIDPQVLLTQIQEHVFEFNLSKSSDVATASVSSAEFEPGDWNFPGLRKCSAPVFETRIESGDRAEEEKGFGEILMLQQRTVLQVGHFWKRCSTYLHEPLICLSVAYTSK
jgi:hypothetical protein